MFNSGFSHQLQATKGKRRCSFLFAYITVSSRVGRGSRRRSTSETRPENRVKSTDIDSSGALHTKVALAGQHFVAIARPGLYGTRQDELEDQEMTEREREREADDAQPIRTKNIFDQAEIFFFPPFFFKKPSLVRCWPCYCSGFRCSSAIV